MPLPPNFNDWEHFQSTLIQVQNRRVRQEFSGEDDDSIATSRASLKQACLLKDNDSALQTLNRLWLFYVCLGQASALHPPVYSMPTDRYQQDVAFAPQVTMVFSEDRSDVETGFAPVTAELSFRIKNERWDTLTPANAQTLATRIRSEFAAGQGYRWHKGRIKLCYRDKDNGYLLTVYAFSESEGRNLITKVLSLQGDTLNLDHLTISRKGQNPAILPPTRMVFGKQRRLPRKRPVAWVRFRYAECHIWGIPDAIILVDNTGRKPGALLYT